MLKSVIKSFMWHPFLFAIFPVLIIFSQNRNFLQWNEIILPIVVVLVITFVIWILLVLIIKNTKKAGLIVSFGVGIFFSYSHIYNLVDDFSFDSFYIRHHYVIAFFILLIGLETFYFIKTKQDIKNISYVANIVSVSLIIIILTYISVINLEDIYLINDKVEIIGSEPYSNKNLPDIYYIILDSYAHETILKDVYNYDNQEFINSLKEKNFFVASQSYSNYRHTFLSFASFLNMKYINYFSNELGSDSRNFHKIYQMTDNNDIMKILKSKGYKIINFASDRGLTGNIEVADVNLCEINPYINSQLLVKIIKSSMLNPIYLDLFDSFNNDRERCVFSELPMIQHKHKEPFFVLAHILIPHYPYRFGPNGEDIPLGTFEPGMEDWDEKKGYLNQVKFANKVVIEIVNKIITESKNSPIIIIQSDSGTSFASDMILSDSGNPVTLEDQNEVIYRKMKILNAYHLPGEGNLLLYDTITPVNSFRIIFNHVFKENYDLLEDKMYYSEYGKELNFSDVSDIRIKK